MVETKKVIAVVVTYNRKELLHEAIVALKEQEYKNLEILVVDNASTDGTKEYIQIFIDNKEILYSNTGSNLGGAGGFNFGMKEAVSRGCDYIWIMDDDTLPKKDALKEMMSTDEILEGDYGFLSSVVLWTDGTHCVMNRQRICKNAYEKVTFLEHGIVPINQATFVSLLFPTEVIVKEGLPIKEFFIWGDDIEYTHRLAKKYSCYLVGKSKVVHAMQNNVGSNIAIDEVARIGRYNYAYRNENYIARREGVYGRMYYLAKCCLHIGRILKYSKDYRMKRTSIILRNMLWGITFNPEIEYIHNEEIKCN